MNNQHQDFVQFNCNGLRGHRLHIQQLIIKYSPKFILLQELKIRKNDKINFKGYTLISKFIDEESQFKPSVGMLIKEGIIYSIIDTPRDICVLGIDTFNVVPISLYSFYDSGRIAKLSESNLKKIIELGKHKPLIMGDFNTKSSLWDRNVSTAWNDKRTLELIHFIDNSELILMNDGSPTRISPIFNHNNSAIDLTLIHKDLISDFFWSVSNSSFGSDHIPTMVTSFNLNQNPHDRIIWNYKSTDWNTFNEFCNLESIKEEMSIDEMDEVIHEQIVIGLNASTHSYKYPNNKKRVVPWWDEELNEYKIKKNRFQKQYIANQTKENLTQLKKFNALYKRALRNKKRESWEKFISEMSDDMEAKDLWKRIRQVNGKNYDKFIMHMRNKDNEIIENPRLIANMLADHYRQVSDCNELNDEEKRKFNVLKSKIIPMEDRTQNDFVNNDENFSLEELICVLSNTNKNSAPGPDGFKYVVYKNFDVKNLKGLLFFFNKIWRLGKRPLNWSKSNIIPVPKVPVVENPTQSRPINLINTKVKLMDKMVNSRLMFTLEESQFIDGNQFGFRRNRKTTDSLMKLNNFIIKTFETSIHVQLVSFDIKKAFDKIWPQAILYKFQQYKIGGKMFQYIESFLSDRSSTVINGQFKSDEIITNIGVPQGSPLSSTLFLVAFQNIIDELKTFNNEIQFSAYADDLIIYTNNDSNLINTKNIQKCINKISKVGLEVGLEFSSEKTKSIHVCNKRNCNQISNKIYGNAIPKVDSLKILGLTIQRKYKFNIHVSILQDKLRKDLQIIKILSSHKYGLNQEILKNIINSLSVSKIRYCIEIYAHTTSTNIKKIDVLLDKMKRLMLCSFVSTPLVTLAVQSGIPNVLAIARKSNVLCSIKMPRNTYEQNVRSNGHINMVNEHIISANLFKVNIVKDETIVSPQRSIISQLYPNIFKKKKGEIELDSIIPTLEDFLLNKNVNISFFTDGSKMSHEVGYAVTSQVEIFEAKKLHQFSSIFSAEAYAIFRAVKLIMRFNPGNDLNFAIFTDSRSTIEALGSNNKKTNEIINSIKKIMSPNICIVWVPSHTGIIGNDFADEAAKDIVQSVTGTLNYLSSSDAVTIIKNYNVCILQREWEIQIDNKLFLIRPLANYASYFNLICRKYEMVMNRIRAGHSYLTHSYIIAKDTQPICKYCKENLTIKHIFECNNTVTSRNRNKHGIIDWEIDVFDVQKIQGIVDFLKEEDYFNLI